MEGGGEAWALAPLLFPFVSYNVVCEKFDSDMVDIFHYFLASEKRIWRCF